MVGYCDSLNIYVVPAEMEAEKWMLFVDYKIWVLA